MGSTASKRDTPQPSPQSQDSTKAHGAAPVPASLEDGVVTHRDKLHEVSNAYKQGSPERILTKCALAGAAGLVLGPIANRGPVLNTCLIGGLNAAMVLGFYDVLREALTS